MKLDLDRYVNTIVLLVIQQIIMEREFTPKQNQMIHDILYNIYDLNNVYTHLL